MVHHTKWANLIHFNRLSDAVSFEASKKKLIPHLKSLLGLKTQCMFSKSSWNLNHPGIHIIKTWWQTGPGSSFEIWTVYTGFKVAYRRRRSGPWCIGTWLGSRPWRGVAWRGVCLLVRRLSVCARGLTGVVPRPARPIGRRAARRLALRYT
jgi:hypothetical protein